MGLGMGLGSGGFPPAGAWARSSGRLPPAVKAAAVRSVVAGQVGVCCGGQAEGHSHEAHSEHAVEDKARVLALLDTHEHDCCAEMAGGAAAGELAG
jgi:hypothetical protein